MLQNYYSAGLDSNCPGMQLEGVWDVDADDSYDVYCSNRKHWVAIRTLSGAGFVCLEGKKTVALDADTLWVMDGRGLTHYGTQNDRWRFRWFMFQPVGALPVAPDVIVRCPDDPRDDADFAELTQALRRETYATRIYATALFTMMLTRWMAHWHGSIRRHPRQDDIERVVDRLHDSMHANWTVEEMADEAGLGIRRFRDVFKEVTGQAPKKFYDGLRLSLAMELLRQGSMTVSEIAVKTGYSCPFHFSKIFKKRFGIAPSHAQTS